ncbi:MAG: hypothetical protein V4505_22555 [Pseudomonadota bacterium]
MKTPVPLVPRRQRPLLAVVGACLLAALALFLSGCGGGSSDYAGVGSGGSGIAEGTVSGFGSVIVDGIEYSDTDIDVATRASLRLGQRVRLVFDANDAAQSIAVLPQLRGPVNAAPDADGWLQVTGQWVRVVQSAADASRSGVTVLGGYTDTGAIVAGQDAAAYGSWAFDASKAAYVLVATRIERQATAADPVLTGGVVSAPLAGIGFHLNAPAGTAVVADGTLNLSAGQVVTVQVARAALGATPLRALAVQNSSLGALDLAAYVQVRIGGLASSYDPASRTVTVQGTPVPLAAGLVVDVAGLASGQFVRLDAGFAGNGLLLVDATAVRPVVAGGGDSGGINQLKGMLSGVDWTAPVVSFTLRGVTTVASAAAIDPACAAVSSSTAQYVEVQGAALAPGAAVVATRVVCSTDVPAGSP